MFGRRKVGIITEFGTTEVFEAGDGIEQGETISPLVWRIFYDPLLRRIQDDPELGYRVETEEITNLNTNEVRKRLVKQAAIAFADDTTWVARSKKEMDRIIQISQRFFKANDIQINSKKSKLIVMNPKKLREERSIVINEDQVKAEKAGSLARLLGVWLEARVNEQPIAKKADQVIKNLVRVLQRKKLTISQLVYINNMCIIPKIVYLLQTTRLSQAKLDQLHQPVLRLIKNKLGLAATTQNCIVTHAGLGICRVLSQEVFSKQLSSLQNRLNSENQIGELTRI